MSRSLFRNEANRGNAQFSTGPRTAEGKSRSRRNSRKHGLCSLIVPPDEDQEEVEDDRKRWVACFSAPDEVSINLADWAFRCKRRADAVADADDALLVLRVREAVEIREAACGSEFSAALSLFKIDPIEGRRRLLATEAGCDQLLGSLELLQSRLTMPSWSDDDSRELIGLEGRPRDDSDPALLGFVETFERFMAVRYSLEVTDAMPPRSVERNMALEEKKTLKPMVATAKEMILERLDNLRRTFEESRERRRGEEDSLVAMNTAAARFDPTEAGRLRRRYFGDAQRDLFKAVAVARQASDQAVSRNEPISDETRSDSSEYSDSATAREHLPADVSRNEAIFEEARPAPLEYSETSVTSEQSFAEVSPNEAISNGAQPTVLEYSETSAVPERTIAEGSRNEAICDPSAITAEVESPNARESTREPKLRARSKPASSISPNEPKSAWEDETDASDFSSNGRARRESPTPGS